MFRLVEQLASNIDDMSLLCGSDAYVSSLGFYNSIKQAAKMNVPNAKPIYDELQKRFPGRPTAKQAEPV
ncbi:hypothetical protein C3K47_06970 [Solitalea longa]|uniref:Uncharacterized protein n=1 Tax=Solitalea longa TaxID=2079460 RepID=A0A2S5A5B7_9SPHI|nr:hypothetical protein [Solitalea longa]POY37499.1 hypothetical protein C3K47_06970 [Solitalea longa]